MKTIIYFILTGMLFSPLLGQNELDIPTYIPPSPETSAFSKYGEIPVSTYTGVPNISIPIYTVISGDLSLPINLSYHASGIKVDQEASWVGLGWTLNAGGMISRTIVNTDDFDGNSYFTSAIPDLTTSMVTYPSQVLDFDCDIDYFDLDLAAYAGWTTSYDFQPDMFSYNFAGMSGSFIMRRDRTIFNDDENNLQFSVFGNQGDSWEITAPNGSVYTFDKIETYFADNDPNAANSRTAWYLSKIRSASGREIELIYTYDSGKKVQTIGGLYDEAVYKLSACEIPGGLGQPPVVADCSRPNIPAAIADPRFYEKPILSEIRFDKGKVVFVSNNTSRVDLPNADRLEAIEIYYKQANGNYAITPSKVFSLDYSYFQGSGDLDVGANSIYTHDHLFKRLKLNKITESAGSQSKPPYEFSYNESIALPAKTSFARDYWGFYNGEIANTGLYPSFKGISYIANEFLDLPGNNRNANPLFNQAFVLQHITFPTGGETELVYESNTYNPINPNDGYKDILPELDEKDLIFVNNQQNTSILEDLNLLNLFEPGAIKVKVSFDCVGLCSNNPQSPSDIATVKILNANTNAIVWDSNYDEDCLDCITIPANSCGSCIVDEQINLTAGEYKVQIDFGHPYLNYVKAELSFYELKDISYGPGLRVVETLVKDDANSDNDIITRFDYHYKQDTDGDGIEEEYSNGKLIARPINFYVSPEAVNGGPFGSDFGGCCIYLVASSNSLVPNNGKIGYDRVTTLYGKNSQDEYGSNGKTMTSYHNTTDVVNTYSFRRPSGLPNFISNSAPLNGRIKEEISYKIENGTFEKVLEKDYDYLTKLPKEEIYGIYRTKDKDVIQPNDCDINAFVYPIINKAWVRLSSEITTTYDQESGEALASEVHYTYESENHQLRSQYTINSDGKIHLSKFKYPTDYDPSLWLGPGMTIGNLINRNFIVQPIETQTWEGTSLNNLALVKSTLATLQDAAKTASEENKLIVSERLYLLESENPIPQSVVESAEGFNSITGKYDKTIPNNFASPFNYSTYKARVIQSYQLDAVPTEVEVVDGIKHAYLWDQDKKLATTKAINAKQANIAYTSFEGLGEAIRGRWTLSFLNGTTSGGWSPVGNGKTGLYRFDLNSSRTCETDVEDAGTYILSFWTTSNLSTFTLNAAPMPSPNVSESSNGWNYFEFQLDLNAGDIVKLQGTSGPNYIDELRLFPKDAQMSTVCFDQNLRVHTQTDLNGNSAYYFYDDLGRLIEVRDQNGDLVSQHEMKYWNE